MGVSGKDDPAGEQERAACAARRGGYGRDHLDRTRTGSWPAVDPGERLPTQIVRELPAKNDGIVKVRHRTYCLREWSAGERGRSRSRADLC
jgi:hypothetical protein